MDGDSAKVHFLNNCSLLNSLRFLENSSHTIAFMYHGQDSFQRLLHKQDGKRAEWEYPFAVAGINISFMLVQMLDLQSGKYGG